MTSNTPWWKAAKNLSNENFCEWQELRTEDGLVYYFNRKTQETTWDKPSELMSEEEKQYASDWVWVPDEREVFIAGRMIDDDGGRLLVELENGEERYCSARSVIPMKQSSLQRIVSDLTLLDEMSVPLIVHCLRKRFESGKIYSAVGSILISINPYTQLDLYTPKMIRKYRNSLEEHREVPPHVFVIADQAYKGLTFEHGINQSIVISGESGAGKTEAAKQCLSYLGAVAGSVAGVEKKVFDANPILEGFGNAKTVRNNNSSRFGKYVEIYMNRHLQLMGGKTTNYLLEKVRVARQGETERNYHFFYMLTKGVDRELRKELSLKQPDHYWFCVQGNSVQVPGINDKNDFEEVKEAFDTLQFKSSSIHSIYRFIAGILHLGNVKFEVVHAKYADDTSKVSNDSRYSLSQACKLWGVEDKAMERGLTNKALVMPGNRTVEKGLNVNSAVDQRDSLCKYIYSKLFDWLVIQINKSMEPQSKVYKSIGLLDIFGFEIFTKNSLEQLCINFCNEKLQQLFNFTVFKLEEKIYKSEDIGVDHVPFIDNQPILDLIEKKPKAILPILDEEGIVPGGSEIGYRTKLTTAFASHKYFRNFIADDQCFILSHYAGDVVYNTRGFIDKNKDILDQGLLIMLDTAKEPIIRTLFPKKLSSMSSATRKMTLSAQFRSQLNRLMQTLTQTEPHYIRCIKPNDDKQPLYFVPRNCFEQLTYSGVFEAVKIRKGGFPFRLKHQLFVERYKCILDELNVRCGNGNRGCEDIVAHLKLPAENVRQGRTMLLYRAQEHKILELKRNIIMEKRKMNETLLSLINTNVSMLTEPELYFERLARAVRSCRRYGITSKLAIQAQKLLNDYVESRIDDRTKRLLEEAIAEKNINKLEEVCAIIEEEQYETDKCKLALRMRDRIHLINRESERAVVTLDTTHMEACLYAAAELEYTNDYVDYFRWMFDTLGKDSEKFVQEQMRQAVKTGDLKRQTRLNIKLKDLVFQKLGQTFAIQNCPILKEADEWASEKIFGREKARLGMMQWTKDDIHSNLTTVENKKWKKLSKEMFKDLQIYMCDREMSVKNQNTQSEDDAGLNVLLKGFSYKELTNEIYCQLVKQLTNNEKPQSVNRGWNLMNICLYLFPPTQELENYLEVFIRNQPRERKDKSLMALQSILYNSSNKTMRKPPTKKDMTDILNGIRPIKRDFLEVAPEVPSWAELTISFNEEKDGADEYFESAYEPLAGSVAPQPKLANISNYTKKPMNAVSAAPPMVSINANLSLGQNLGPSSKMPTISVTENKTEPKKKKKNKMKFNNNKNNESDFKSAAAVVNVSAAPAVKSNNNKNNNNSNNDEEEEYEWLCHLDHDSGDVFYENMKTGDTTWDRPSGAVRPMWLSHLDPESSEMYFENIDTGETTWSRPKEFCDPDEKWMARLDDESGDYYYENMQTQETTWDTPLCFQETVSEVQWLRHFDPNSGDYYFENTVTGETTWEQPAGVKFD